MIYMIYMICTIYMICMIYMICTICMIYMIPGMYDLYDMYDLYIICMICMIRPGCAIFQLETTLIASTHITTESDASTLRAHRWSCFCYLQSVPFLERMSLMEGVMIEMVGYIFFISCSSHLLPSQFFFLFLLPKT